MRRAHRSMCTIRRGAAGARGVYCEAQCKHAPMQAARPRPDVTSCRPRPPGGPFGPCKNNVSCEHTLGGQIPKRRRARLGAEWSVVRHSGGPALGRVPLGGMQTPKPRRRAPGAELNNPGRAITGVATVITVAQHWTALGACAARVMLPLRY